MHYRLRRDGTYLRMTMINCRNASTCAAMDVCADTPIGVRALPRAVVTSALLLDFDVHAVALAAPRGVRRQLS